MLAQLERTVFLLQDDVEQPGSDAFNVLINMHQVYGWGVNSKVCWHPGPVHVLNAAALLTACREGAPSKQLSQRSLLPLQLSMTCDAVREQRFREMESLDSLLALVPAGYAEEQAAEAAAASAASVRSNSKASAWSRKQVCLPECLH